MDKFIKSPLNYTGGKYKLLPQILPLFPEGIDNFYDLFTGGANVNAKKIFAFDINKNVIEFFQYLKTTKINYLLGDVSNVIKHYEGIKMILV